MFSLNCHLPSQISAVDSGGAGGTRAPPKFWGSEKGQSLISAYRSLAITTNTPGFKKLSMALTLCPPLPFFDMPISSFCSTVVLLDSTRKFQTCAYFQPMTSQLFQFQLVCCPVISWKCRRSKFHRTTVQRMEIRQYWLKSTRGAFNNRVAMYVADHESLLTQ